MALFSFKINQLKLKLTQEELVEYCGLGLHKQGVTVSLRERMNNATTLSFQRLVKGIRRRSDALHFLLP